jgi:hypothetical protein
MLTANSSFNRAIPALVIFTTIIKTPAAKTNPDLEYIFKGLSIRPDGQYQDLLECARS